MIEKVGAVLTSATILSGCTPSFVNAVTPPFLYPEVSIEELPDTLPDAVAEQIPNVVSIINNIPVLSESGICSGVRIDKHDYLSAGHCDYSLASDALPFCTELSVGSTSIISPDGVILKATKKAGNYGGDTSGIWRGDVNSMSDDTLLIETDAEPRPYTTPTQYGEPSMVTTGMPLYLVNYEPTADGKLRSPFNKYLTESELNAGLNKPAIFGAIALMQYANGMIAAISGDKPYSSPPETDVRGGASGGPVYDQNGSLIGTAVNLINYSSLSEAERDFGVSITGISEKTDVNVFLIQDITPSLVSELQSEQQPTPDC